MCFVADGGWFDCFVGVFDSVALILIEFGFAVMMCLVMGWLFVCCVSGLSLCCCWLNDWCLMVVYIGFWLCLFYGSWGGLVCWYFGVWLCAVTCGYCGCVSDFGRVDCDGGVGFIV